MLPRQKICPLSFCLRRWNARPATASKCPGCGYLLVDLRPGDDGRAYKGEAVECFKKFRNGSSHPDYLVVPKFRDRPEKGIFDEPIADWRCPVCVRDAEAAVRLAVKQGMLENDKDAIYDAIVELLPKYWDHPSRGWRKPAKIVPDRIFATTFTAKPIPLGNGQWEFPRRQDEPIMILERIESGPYSTFGGQGFDCPGCSAKTHVLSNSRCLRCRHG